MPSLSELSVLVDGTSDKPVMRTCRCMCTGMHTWVCTHTHTHTHTQSQTKFKAESQGAPPQPDSMASRQQGDAGAGS